MPDEGAAIHRDKTAAPSFKALFRQPSAWGTCFGHFGYNYVSYFLLTWLPYYLVNERHFSMVSMAKIGGAAYILGACMAVLSGRLSDRWIKAGATPTVVRKTFVAGGISGAGVLLLCAALSPTSVSVVLLTLGIMCQSVGSSNVWAITQTLAGPYAAGRWTGLQNFVGNLSGIIGPALTGVVLQRTGHFYWPFAIVTAIALMGASSWVFVVGPVKPVTWPEAGTPDLPLQPQRL
jgi:sugar phosphate permease